MKKTNYEIITFLFNCDNEKDFIEKWKIYESQIDYKACSYLLCMFTTRFFKFWWDPNKFNWEFHFDYLQKHCKRYKHIWEKDYLKWKLKNI